MMKKKGAIELSVTAIVILILAIVILGLALGFVRGMFTKVAVSFEEQVSAEPEPQQPTSGDPLTLSRETLIVRSGDPIALKVGIHNSGEVDWTNANVTIICNNAATMITQEQANLRALNSGQSYTGTYLFVVGKISEGTYLCSAKIQHTPSGGPNATKDMTIKISR